MIINIKKYVGEFRPLKRFFDSELNDYVPKDSQLFVSVAESLLQYKYRGKWKRWTSASHARAAMTGVLSGELEPVKYYPFSAGPFAPAFVSVASDEINVDPNNVSDTEASTPLVNWVETLSDTNDIRACYNVEFQDTAIVFSELDIMFRGAVGEGTSVFYARDFYMDKALYEWDANVLYYKNEMSLLGAVMMPPDWDPYNPVEVTILSLPYTDFLYDMTVDNLEVWKQQIEVMAINPAGNSVSTVLQSDNQTRVRDVTNSGSAVNQNWAVQDLESDITSGTDEVFKTADCT